MKTVSDILNILYGWAPPETAMDFDNVGLLVGEPDTPVSRIVTALDCTPDVIRSADENGANLIVTHHPLIFHPLKRLTGADRTQSLAIELLRRRIALISMHTNLDAAEGGVNACLAHALGLADACVLPGTDGIVRIGTLPCTESAGAFLARVKDALRIPSVRFTGNARTVHRAAVGGGACADYRSAVLAAGCDAFVTSEIKHHEWLEFDGSPMLLIDAGHFATEYPVVSALAGFLRMHTGCPCTVFEESGPVRTF